MAKLQLAKIELSRKELLLVNCVILASQDFSEYSELLSVTDRISSAIDSLPVVIDDPLTNVAYISRLKRIMEGRYREAKVA